jgi:uncharacterized damage-inducible protein DinB
MFERFRCKAGGIPAMTTTPDSTMTSQFLAYSHSKLIAQSWPRLRECVQSLTDEQLWWRPNDASNSIGNLLLHLNGNVRQWLVVSFNALEDTRNRPAEFSAQEGATAAVLLTELGRTLDEASIVLRRLTEADLLRRYKIQEYDVSGLEAVYKVVEHFGMHYGQILYVTKMFRNEDLGYFSELKKSGKAPHGSSNS